MVDHGNVGTSRAIMDVIKPPSVVPWNGRASVFLAGTIDSGQSADWQYEAERALSSLDILVLNPRRDEWDATWEQTIHNPKFREQVTWELDGLEHASQIFMHFAGGSQSPITLLELGLTAGKGNLTIVCEKTFWRRGNIEVVAGRYGLDLHEDFSVGIASLKGKLSR